MPHENNKPAKSCFRDATAAHDAETVRLVREIAEAWDRWNGTSGFERGVKRVAEDILTILNRPAKKGKKNG